MINSKRRADVIRILSMDAVQKAKSGHPGAPMGMADIAEVLWTKHLKHNPGNPLWHNRDRFVLSNGHGSMLIYTLLHLTGYDVTIEDLKNFRQLHSRTPGHPEFGYTPGVETTTGPLGQGLANAVGMAIAEKTQAAQFNQPGHNIVDHYTYIFLGDGCMMEGISHEVSSLAGTLGLGKLIAFYDDNGISIDGKVEGWFTDDTAKRFEAYGWQVIADVDGHSAGAIDTAIEMAKADTERPTLICCKTIIGCGAPNKAGTASSHGSPLGEEEIALVRKQLDWKYPPFIIPDAIYQSWNACEQGATEEAQWNQRFSQYETDHPQQAKEFKRRISKQLPEDFSSQADLYINHCQARSEKVASRKASQNALNAFGPLLPELTGGSADLAGSNLTLWQDAKGISKEDASGNYIFYGVREFGMTAIMNGMALHGGFIPYGGTFLVFTDYARNAVRMSALMKQHVIHVYTHDSIGLGEDGPTHQPVEHLSTLRMTPNLYTWRPCDETESAVAWKQAVEYTKGPTALVFSRQGLPAMSRNKEQLKNIERGGYILKDCTGTPDLIFIATGSEVGLAAQAEEMLSKEGYRVRLVSMPCTSIFDRQTAQYRELVLPQSVSKRIAVEAAHTDYWHKYVGLNGRIVGLNSFGESAPAAELFKHFGLTVENVIMAAKKLLNE
ncbi:MAG: transketolase [Endozoicomonadaceae bacterium]|nr:transketolase [Endozoicomonadaceae bacterium]